MTSATKALDDAARRVSKYLLRQALVNTAFGLVVSVGLWFLGVPYPLLWGLMGAGLRYVPYVGTWLAAIMPVLLSIAVSPGWTQPLLTFGLFVVLDVVVANVIEPVLYGRSIGVSGTALLIAAGEHGHTYAALLRDLHDPYHAITLDPALRTPVVVTLANAAYEARVLPAGEFDVQRLAVLSDALEEAGCADDVVLSHLRSPGPHVRGCWALDLILGKE